MSPLKMLQDPIFLRRFHGWTTMFWLLNFPPVIALYIIFPAAQFQKFCLLYLALVSIWANVAGHWSAWQAARIEVKEDQRANDDDPSNGG